jgi:hypothetical protein
MKNVLKKINVLGLISIIIFATLCFTGCVSGVVSEEQYCELVDGVEAQDENGNTIYYQMRTLVDNTEFNESIQSKAYCKLDIYLTTSCQIKGVVFIVRSSDNCTLKFITYIDGESVSSNTKEITSENITDINLFFENTTECNSRSDFYIEIEEQNKEDDEEKTSFKFDSLIIFLEE